MALALKDVNPASKFIVKLCTPVYQKVQCAYRFTKDIRLAYRDIVPPQDITQEASIHIHVPV